MFAWKNYTDIYYILFYNIFMRCSLGLIQSTQIFIILYVLYYILLNMTQIYEMFAWSNPLHTDIFPDVRKMEAEIIQMCVDMYNGDRNACGSVSLVYL